MARIKPIAQLRDWASFQLEGKTRFAGIVSGHPKIKDGEEMFTSAMVAMTNVDGVKKVETQNTIYILVGEPSTELHNKLQGLGLIERMD